MFKFLSKLAGGISNAKLGKTSAIILCAGSSTRFGDDKQMAEVSGKSVALRTIEVFDSCDLIFEIILVVRKEDVENYKNLVCKNGLRKVSCIVVGGDTRQSSALRGFKHVSEKAKLVAIHDGARCLVTNEIITAVVKSADEYKAATAASKVYDTVKIADRDGFISKTVDRELVWNVQTPQVFEKKLYMACAYNAKENDIIATDDCMLLESAGFKVKLVDTGKNNIKITVKEDIKLAEYILSLREE